MEPLALLEEKVPVGERRLVIEGEVSPSSCALVRAGLPAAWPTTARCLFAIYAYADLPIGKRYEFAFPSGDPLAAEPTIAIVHAVTQQWGKPFDNIPHGWKTILLIDFPNGVPSVIESLPTVDEWGQSGVKVGLCTQETLDEMLRLQTPRYG